MAPGEKREMPVVFYVDPSIADDPENDGLNTITLSYTFYPVRDPVAEAAGGRRRRQTQGKSLTAGLTLGVGTKGISAGQARD